MKKLLRFFALLLFLNFWHLYSATAQANKFESTFPVIDKIVKAFADTNQIPGYVYGIIAEGKLIHTGQGGFSNLDKKLPASASAAFRIASMTKSFTAMAILKLRDEGKLGLDDPVYQYIPAMKEQHYPVADAAPVTIRQLLTHAAGFPEDNPWGDRQLDISEQSMIDMIRKGISYSNVPGIAYEYSNMGFAMLGQIIKVVSGKSYQDYINLNILQPLHMNDTYWDYRKVPADKLAHGYRWLSGKWQEQPMLGDGAYGAMGGMITTMDDFSKYIAFHLNAWPPRNEKEEGTVKRSSLREMHQPWNFNQLSTAYRYPNGRLCPIVSAYGYGLRWIKDCDNRIVIGHSGGLPGFGSDWRMLPDYGLGVVFYGNLTYAPGGLINMRVLDTLIAMTGLRPRPVPVSAVLEQRKQELIRLLPAWNNAAATGIFADNFFLDYFPGSLRKEATDIFGRAGKIVRIQELVALNYLRGSFILEGENKRIRVSFTLSPENPPLIQEYHIEELEKE